MKNIHFAIAAALLLHTPGLFAGGINKIDPNASFPHVIQFELGASGFADGDQVTITAVRGSEKHIKPGGDYLVEGSYTLSSADSANLALFCTSRGPSGSTPVQEGQSIRITRGAGKFVLYETNMVDGWLHVSIYPGGSSSGGVYFGEKGKEDTIMRKQSWFSGHPTGRTDTITDAKNDPNRALMAYLGDPVPAPANLDPRYTNNGLIHAVQLAAENAGLNLKKVMIDDSEYPFLIGVACEGQNFPKWKAQIKQMEGYEESGGVGSDNTFVACIVPHKAFAEGTEQRIYHRLMLREAVFFEKLDAR